MISRVKKILIIRFSSIGDIVLTTPIIRCLKEQLGAEVHFLTKNSFSSLLANNPNVGKVFGIEQKIFEVLAALRRENYDFIIDLHNNLRSRQTCFLLNKKTFRFDKLNVEKWWLVKFKIHRLPNIHLVERYFNTVKMLGVIDDGKGLDFFIPRQQEVEISEILGKSVTKYVVLVVGAAHATKRLPNDKIIGICQSIFQPIILLGGKKEMADGAEIAQKSGSHVHHLCGKLTLEGSASVIKQAEIVVTPDTGLMHIAAAFHKKIIAIWGNTVPEFGMYPYRTTFQNVEVKNLSCRPCSKIGFSACPKGHFNCIRNIENQEIVQLILAMQNVK